MDKYDEEDLSVYKYQEYLPRRLEELNEFLNYLEACEVLTDIYKESLKEGIQNIIEASNNILNGKLESNFDCDAYDKKISEIGKNAKFAKPIMKSNNLFSAAWINSANDYTRNKISLEIKETYGLDGLFNDFNSHYIVAYKNDDMPKILEVAKSNKKKIDAVFNPIESEKASKSIKFKA